MRTTSCEQIGTSGEIGPRVMNDARELAKQDIRSGVCLRRGDRIGEYGVTLPRQVEDVMMNPGPCNDYRGIRIGDYGEWTVRKMYTVECERLEAKNV